MGKDGKKTLKGKVTCLFCDQDFANHRSLEAHTNTHTDERPYFCNYCDATFKSNWATICHRNSVHLGITYDCSNCGKRFRDKRNFKSHQKICSGRATAGGKGLNSEDNGVKEMEDLLKPQGNEADGMMKYPELVYLVGLPLGFTNLQFPVRQEPRWDPMFFLHMNKCKEEEEGPSTISSKKPETPKAQRPPPEVKAPVSKVVSVSGEQGRAPVKEEISKAKKKEPNKVVVKLNIPRRSTKTNNREIDKSNCSVA